MVQQRGNARRLTHEQFLERLRTKHGSAYTVMTPYVQTNVKVQFRHEENGCGHIFEMRPNDILGGQMCPKCAMERRRASKAGKRLGLSAFAIRIAESDVGRKWALVEDQQYVDNKTSYRIRCSDCHQEVVMSPVNFAQGRRCPRRCHGGLSRGAQAVKAWLDFNHYTYQMEFSFSDCRHQRTLRFDFAVFVEGKIFLIEYDGELHDRSRFSGPPSQSVEACMTRDAVKDRYCEEKAIPLLRIDYTELAKDVVSQKLRGFLPPISTRSND